MLEFFEIKDFDGQANLYANYITFSKALIEALDDAYRVRVAVDKENKQIHFIKVTKDQALSKELDEKSLLKVGITKTYARICSAKMMNFIYNSFNLSVEGKNFIKADAFFDESKNTVIVDLSEVIE